MDIEAEREITMVYATDIPQQGSYKFIGEVKYGNDTTMNVKTVYASSCQDLTPRKAIGPGNICNDFTTVCEVPAGWKVVSDCDAQPNQETKGDLSLFIWIAAIVIVLAFIWFFKDKLMELMKKIRYRLYYMGS
jgi:hypothetical protein